MLEYYGSWNRMNQIGRERVPELLEMALGAMEQTTLSEWIAITQERARAREDRSTALARLMNASMPEVRRQVRAPTPEHQAHKAAVRTAFTRASNYCKQLPETMDANGEAWHLRDEALGATADLIRAVGNAPFASGDEKAKDSLALLLEPFFRFAQYQTLKDVYGL